MAFNRLADAQFDAANPRTADRALPAGKISRGATVLFIAASAAIFMGAAAQLNRLCFALSPVALLVILGYSYTKRFTAASHLVLGLSLGLAPVGGWLAVRGDLSLAVLVLAGAVLFWVAGFDILYALQDEDFDRRVGTVLPAGPGGANLGPAPGGVLPSAGGPGFCRHRAAGRPGSDLCRGRGGERPDSPDPTSVALTSGNPSDCRRPSLPSTAWWVSAWVWPPGSVSSFKKELFLPLSRFSP